MAKWSTIAVARSFREERLVQMEAIVAQYEASLLGYAGRIVRDGNHAQDIVQNTFIKLFRNWKKGTQPSQQLKAWLYRTTHNEAVDLIRRESRLSKLHERHAEDEDSARHIGDTGPDNARERVELVIEQIHLLSTGEQQVLLLRLEEGMSYEEIAGITGRTTGNVGCILHNAVKKLAEKLGHRQPAHKVECSTPNVEN